VPGSTDLPSSICDDNEHAAHDGQSLGSLIYVATIVPIVCGLLILCCCGFCIYYIRKDKRKKRNGIRGAAVGVEDAYPLRQR
jgi:hypothetical protein